MECLKQEVNYGDPNDWPDTWHELRDIDTLLRCSICCEYMNTSMLLAKCSHSYCSLCIRRSISYKTQCPTCFVAATEGDMINNRSLNEVIHKFSVLRSRLLKILSSHKFTGSTSTHTTNHDGHLDTSQPSLPASTRVKKFIPTGHNFSFVKAKLNGVLDPSSSSTKRTVTKRKLHSKKGAMKKDTCEPILCVDLDDHTTGSDSASDCVYRLSEESLDSTEDDFEVKVSNFKPAKRRKSLTRNSKYTKLSKACQRDANRGAITSCRGTTSVTAGTRYDESNRVQRPSASSGTSSGDCDVMVVSQLQYPSQIPSKAVDSSISSSLAEASAASTSGTYCSSMKPGGALVRVPCPVCGVEVSNKHINLHLDRCLSNKDRTIQTRSAPRRKQMPKLVYNLLSDKELKKKCQEAGLNNQGDRQTLTKRHHDFTLLYNSQCDSSDPMSAIDVVREVERAERAKRTGLKLKGMVATNKLVIQKGASSDQVQSAQKAYVKQHKSQFDQLIAEARERRLKKQAAAVNQVQLTTGEKLAEQRGIDDVSIVSDAEASSVECSSGNPDQLNRATPSRKALCNTTGDMFQPLPTVKTLFDKNSMLLQSRKTACAADNMSLQLLSSGKALCNSERMSLQSLPSTKMLPKTGESSQQLLPSGKMLCNSESSLLQPLQSGEVLPDRSSMLLQEIPSQKALCNTDSMPIQWLPSGKALCHIDSMPERSLPSGVINSPQAVEPASSQTCTYDLPLDQGLVLTSVLSTDSNCPKSNKHAECQEPDEDEAETQFVESDMISDAMLSQMVLPENQISSEAANIEADIGVSLDDTLPLDEEVEEGDATMPLDDADCNHLLGEEEEESQLVVSDDDMFGDSPGSPSLLSDTTSATSGKVVPHHIDEDPPASEELVLIGGVFTVVAPAGGEDPPASEELVLTGRAFTVVAPPSGEDPPAYEELVFTGGAFTVVAPPGGYPLSADTDTTAAALTEKEPEEPQCHVTMPQEKRKRGRPKKGSRAKSNVAGVATSNRRHTAPEPVAPSTVGYLHMQDPAGLCDSTDDLASETLSESVSVVSSVSYRSGFHGHNMPSMQDKDLGACSDDVPQPRRPGRPRRKRKRSSGTDRVGAPPASKQTRRPSIQNVASRTPPPVATSVGQGGELTPAGGGSAGRRRKRSGRKSKRKI